MALPTHETMHVDPHRAVAAARDLIDQSQEELAEALTQVTGKKWSRVMVANLETDRKDLLATVLRDIAEIQGFPIQDYFYRDRLLGSGTRPGYEAREAVIPMPLRLVEAA